MGVAENPGKLGPQLPGAALMAMILHEAWVHPGNVGLYLRELHLKRVSRALVWIATDYPVIR